MKLFWSAIHYYVIWWTQLFNWSACVGVFTQTLIHSTLKGQTPTQSCIAVRTNTRAMPHLTRFRHVSFGTSQDQIQMTTAVNNGLSFSFHTSSPSFSLACRPWSGEGIIYHEHDKLLWVVLRRGSVSHIWVCGGKRVCVQKCEKRDKTERRSVKW